MRSPQVSRLIVRLEWIIKVYFLYRKAIDSSMVSPLTHTESLRHSVTSVEKKRKGFVEKKRKRFVEKKRKRNMMILKIIKIQNINQINMINVDVIFYDYQPL